MHTCRWEDPRRAGGRPVTRRDALGYRIPLVFGLQAITVQPFFPAVQPSISAFYCKLLDNLIKACYSPSCLLNLIFGRHVVLLAPPKSSHPRSLLPGQHLRLISLLDATLMKLPVSVANKGLTVWLSLLDATLTKNTGVGAVCLWKFPVALTTGHYTQVLSFHILAHSFALAKISTLLFSSNSALFAENHPGWGYPSTRFPYLATSLLPLILTGGVN